MNIKEPAQKFTPAQTLILIGTVLVMSYGVYAYFTKLPDKTIFVQKMKVLMMTQEELDAIQAAKEKAEEDAFFADEDDF